MVRGSISEPSTVRINGLPIDLTGGTGATVSIAIGFPEPSATFDSASGQYLMPPTCLATPESRFCDVPLENEIGQGGFLFIGGTEGPIVVYGSSRLVPLDGVNDLNGALVEIVGLKLTFIGVFSQEFIATLVREIDPLGGLVRAFVPAILIAPTSCNVIPAEAGIQSCSYIFIPPSGVGDGSPSLPLAFQTSVTLAEGTNSILVTAIDLAGNSALPVSRAVTLDTVPPQIAFNFPAPNTRTNDPNVPVRVSYSDVAPGFTPGDTTTELTLLLPDGTHTLDATISDRAGHAGSAPPVVFMVVTPK